MSDEWIRRLAAAAVLAVAAIAAVVSYVHIETLAASHHQGRLAAWMVPLSVDGTVAAASLQMLRAARAGQETHWLQRTMLVAGVVATLAANVLYGWPHGLVAAVISGWPAAAFIGSAEMAILSIRHQAAAAARTSPGKTRAGTGPARAKRAAAGRPGGRAGQQRSAQDTDKIIADLLRDRPALSNTELATLSGLPRTTVRRGRKRVDAAAAAEGRAA